MDPASTDVLKNPRHVPTSSHLMKPRSINPSLGRLLVACALLSASLSAAPIVSGETNHDSGFAVSNTDLLQTNLVSTLNQLSINGGENGPRGGTVAMLTDGSFGPLGASGGLVINGGSITYELSTSGQTGYDIQEIHVHSGWDDDGRDGQSYSVSYATVDDPTTFMDIASVSRDETGRFEKTSITASDAPAPLASNVKFIRISFTGQENGGVGYKEIDVIGASAVPTPRNLIWDNGALTNAWNATDLNWGGTNWDNNRPDLARFITVGGAINLANITAGFVSVGNAAVNVPSTTFIGGSLATSGLTMQGFANNGGSYDSNPTLELNSTVLVNGDVTIGRANLRVVGGSLSANRIISASESADWGRLVIAGGTVTAEGGVNGSVNTLATFAVDLNGGELQTPFIRVANREFGPANNAWLTLNGGKITAIGTSNSQFITTYGGGNNVYVGNGGVWIDTNGFDLGVPVNLVSDGGNGGLIKDGPGTLSLSGSYNYSGATVVNQGTLELASATLSDAASVHIGASAVLKLPDGATDTVQELVIDGVSKGPGTWNAANTEGRITGGSLLVPVADPYLAWIEPFFPGETDPTIISGGADPDHDGLSNLLEYVLKDGQPAQANATVLPNADASGAQFVFTYQRRAAASNATQTFEYSTSLAADSWTPIAIPGGEGVVVSPAADGIETVQITLPKASNTGLFGRLKVTK